MSLAHDFRKLKHGFAAPITEEAVKMAEDGMREAESRDAAKPSGRRVTSPADSTNAGAKHYKRAVPTPAVADYPAPRLHGSVAKKTTGELVGEKYKVAMKSIHELGGVIAMAKAGNSDAAFATIIAGAGMKPAEAQSYIDFAAAYAGEKPKARRVNKSTKRESDPNADLYMSI